MDGQHANELAIGYERSKHGVASYRAIAGETPWRAGTQWKKHHDRAISDLGIPGCNLHHLHQSALRQLAPKRGSYLHRFGRVSMRMVQHLGRAATPREMAHGSSDRFDLRRLFSPCKGREQNEQRRFGDQAALLSA